MANADTPFGFRATGVMMGTQRFERDADDATAVFRGDMLNAMADGNVQPAAAGTPAPGTHLLDQLLAVVRLHLAAVRQDGVRLLFDELADVDKVVRVR